MPSVVNANMRMRLLNEDELDPPNLFEDLRECLAQEGRRSDQMFRQFDIDGTGGVDREEFAIVCKEMGYDASPEELDALFKAFDKDGNGKRAYTVRMTAPPPPRALPPRRRTCNWRCTHTRRNTYCAPPHVASPHSCRRANECTWSQTQLLSAYSLRSISCC
jgi:hypothetical protein